MDSVITSLFLHKDSNLPAYLPILDNLTSIKISDYKHNIDFQKCVNLTSLDVDNYNYSFKNLEYCRKLKNINIDNSRCNRHFDLSLFNNLTSLKVKYCKSELTNCVNLTSIDFNHYEGFLDLTKYVHLTSININYYDGPSLDLTKCVHLTNINISNYNKKLDLTKCVNLTSINLPNYTFSLENISHFKKILYLNINNLNEYVTLDKNVTYSLLQETISNLQEQIDELKKDNEKIKLQIKEIHHNDIIKYYC
jgi:hypothetical protein